MAYLDVLAEHKKHSPWFDGERFYTHADALVDYMVRIKEGVYPPYFDLGGQRFTYGGTVVVNEIVAARFWARCRVCNDEFSQVNALDRGKPEMELECPFHWEKAPKGAWLWGWEVEEQVVEAARKEHRDRTMRAYTEEMLVEASKGGGSAEEIVAVVAAQMPANGGKDWRKKNARAALRGLEKKGVVAPVWEAPVKLGSIEQVILGVMRDLEVLGDVTAEMVVATAKPRLVKPVGKDYRRKMARDALRSLERKGMAKVVWG